jgi:hypothetical protein
LVGLASAAVVVGGAIAWQANDPAPIAAAAAEPRPRPTAAPNQSGGARWLRALDHLDRIRWQAWRTGDPAALGRVYVPGSSALRADRAMLAAYRARRLRVSARVDFRQVRVVDRDGEAVTLAVVDQLGAAVATSPSDGAVALPSDQPTAHTIVLQRVGGRWRIAAIRAT